jgi:hypothetical protein
VSKSNKHITSPAILSYTAKVEVPYGWQARWVCGFAAHGVIMPAGLLWSPPCFTPKFLVPKQGAQRLQGNHVSKGKSQCVSFLTRHLDVVALLGPIHVEVNPRLCGLGLWERAHYMVVTLALCNAPLQRLAPRQNDNQTRNHTICYTPCCVLNMWCRGGGYTQSPYATTPKTVKTPLEQPFGQTPTTRAQKVF